MESLLNFEMVLFCKFFIKLFIYSTERVAGFFTIFIAKSIFRSLNNKKKI